METARPLPDFGRPPVTEVVLDVQFDELAAFRVHHLGLVWQEFRSTYPRVEEHPPLDPLEERLRPLTAGSATMRFEVLNLPLVPRLWLLNDAGTDLIQVQKDRFIRNGRKTKGGNEYPRYGPLSTAFRNELARFQGFVTREGLGELRPTLCEVSYINHIEPCGVWERHGQLGEVFRIWAPRLGDDFLPDAESARLSVQYLMCQDAEDEPLGRLYIVVEPGFRSPDNTPLFVMRVTARGRPIGEDVEGIFRFMDVGREWIVRSFASVTTPAMHRHWERRDAG